MGKDFNFDFPPVLDENNQPLSAEEAEKLTQAQPFYVPFTVVRNGRAVTYSLATDLNNVDDAAMAAYDEFKAARYAIFRTRPAKVQNGKADDSDEPSGEQVMKSAKMRPQEHKVFLGLLFPRDWEDNPVVLGSNCPDVPTDAAERRAWFERGGVVARAAMEAVVMQIDPTGPLAQEKESAARAETLHRQMEEALTKKLEEIEGLDLNSLLSATASSNEPSSPVENTIQEPSSDLPSDGAGATESAGDPGSSLSETP